MRGLIEDLRFGVRSLLKSPGLSFAAVLCVALGVGANSAIFSVVDSVLLKPLPFPDAKRLHHFRIKPFPTDFLSFSIPDYIDFGERNQLFEEVGVALFDDRLTLEGEPPSSILATGVTASYFDTLGVKAKLGRTFVEEDADQRRAVLSHQLWVNRFGADPGILGKTIGLSLVDHQVIGVMPPTFLHPMNPPDHQPEVFFLFTARSGRRDHIQLKGIGRLKDGVSPAQAQAETDSIAAALQQEHPSINAEWGWEWTLIPLRRAMHGDVPSTLALLFASTGLVLLIACANVANLLLARSIVRRREIAVRSALGASAARLARQMLAESAVLGVSGGILGLLLALASTQSLARLAAQVVPNLEGIRIDFRVLCFAAAASLASSLLIGLWPASSASRANVIAGLQDGARGVGGGQGRRRVSFWLVGSEVALALIVALTTGLLVKSFAKLQSVDPGFRSQGVLGVGIRLHPSYGLPEEIAGFFSRVQERVGALPEVERVGLIDSLYFGDSPNCVSVAVPGEAEMGLDEAPCAKYRPVTPGTLDALGVRLMEGRGFDNRDGPDSARVALVNERLAQIFLGGREPLGEQVVLARTVTATIVGVVESVKDTRLDEPEPPQIYVPFDQERRVRMTLVVQTAHSQPEALLPVVRRAIHEIDPSLALYQPQTMQSLIQRSTGQPRLRTLLMALFTLTSLALAAVGIFGVISFWVSRRLPEIGLRMAMGAERRDVLRMVILQGMRPVLVGLTVGVAASMALGQVLSSFLFQVSPLDPSMFALATFFLLAVAVAACWLPARRASRIDPLSALRCE